jgi:hypothetical protein
MALEIRWSYLSRQWVWPRYAPLWRVGRLWLKGFFAGEIDFTTKGSRGEVSYSMMGAPTAFWFVALAYLVFGIVFLVMSYFILKNDNPP